MEAVEYGKRHLRFAFQLYNLQRELGLYFLHEQPAHASSWQDPEVTKLLAKPDVERVVSDMCLRYVSGG